LGYFFAVCSARSNCPVMTLNETFSRVYKRPRMSLNTKSLQKSRVGNLSVKSFFYGSQYFPADLSHGFMAQKTQFFVVKRF